MCPSAEERASGRAFMFVTESNLVILIVALSAITAVIGVRDVHSNTSVRVEYARLREGLDRLSEDIKHLMVAEQRRFLKELKSSKDEGASTANEPAHA